MTATNPTPETTSERGIDLDALGAFVEHVGNHPDEGMSEWSARAAGEATAGLSQATVGPFSAGGQEIDRDDREYTISTGVPREMGEALGFVDPTDRMKATEAALSALAGCITGTITLGTLPAGIELDEVRTTVSVSSDPRVLLGLHDLDRAENTFEDVHIDVEVEGDDLTDESFARIEDLVQRSPVYNLICLSNTCETSVEAAEA